MASSNSVNGEWMGQNRPLLTGVLRDLWNWNGITGTDFVRGLRDGGAALEAGKDLEEPFAQIRATHLRTQFDAGECSWESVERSGVRILATQLRSYAKRLQVDPGSDVMACDAHRALAREAAARSMVLLKNEPVDGQPILPLASDIRSIAVIGRLAVEANIGDNGSSKVRAPDSLRAQTICEETTITASATKPPPTRDPPAPGYASKPWSRPVGVPIHSVRQLEQTGEFLDPLAALLEGRAGGIRPHQTPKDGVLVCVSSDRCRRLVPRRAGTETARRTISSRHPRRTRVLADLTGQHIDGQITKLSNDVVVTKQTVDVVVVPRCRRFSNIVALSSSVMQQDQLVHQGPHRFKHQQAHRCGLVEIDRQSRRLNVLDYQRLNRQPSLRQRTASRTDLDQHPRPQNATRTRSRVFDDGGPFLTFGRCAPIDPGFDAGRDSNARHEHLQGRITSTLATSRQHCDQIDILGEPLDQPMRLRQTRAALEHDRTTRCRRRRRDTAQNLSDPKVLLDVIGRNARSSRDT